MARPKGEECTTVRIPVRMARILGLMRRDCAGRKEALWEVIGRLSDSYFKLHPKEAERLEGCADGKGKG